MAQAVSRRPLTADARLRVRISPCGICGRQSGIGTSLTPSFKGFLCQYNFTMAHHTHVSSGE
jgi:hypothetical protein